jgi:hypothetical protein
MPPGVQRRDDEVRSDELRLSVILQRAQATNIFTVPASSG